MKNYPDLEKDFPDKTVIKFDTYSDILNIINSITSEERNKVANSGQELIIKNFTYESFVTNIKKEVNLL